MKNLKYVLSSLFAVSLLIGCSDESEENNNGSDNNNPLKIVELTEKSRSASNKLGDFYTAYTCDVADFIDGTGKRDANFVVSPLSLSMALAMTGNAVTGELQQEIISYLGVEDLDAMNELSSTLLETLPNLDKKTTMTLANSVWVERKYSLNDDFKSVATDVFNCELGGFSVDNKSSAVRDLNNWVSDKTAGKITDFFKEDDISDVLAAILINALHFKSEWRASDLFSTSKTSDRWFYGATASNEVPTMESRESAMDCYFDDDYVYVKVPFGNGAYNFEVLVLSSGKPLDFLNSVSREKLRVVRNSAEEYDKVTLQLPKFRMEYDVKLDELLRSVGIEHIGNMGEMSLFTEEYTGQITLRQKVMFEVNEKGAEAAAVTSSGLITAPAPSEPVRIDVNRPFMFFITEQSTGAVVVSGRVADL